MAEHVPTQNRRLLLLGLAGALGVVFFVFPLAAPYALLDPDEGLHAAVAQEMVERGDWIVPRLLGEPFWDKPALFTWLQAVSLRLLGMNEAAVRLPGLLFGLLAVLATGWAAGRLAGRHAAPLAAVFYATLALPTALSQAAPPDALLVPVVTCTLVLLWEMGQPAAARTNTRRILAAGAILGFGTLAKGLVGIALVAVAYSAYLLARLWLGRMSGGAAAGQPACEESDGRSGVAPGISRGLARLALVVGIAVLVAVPWYVAMQWRNPGYLYYYFVDRHLRGFVTATQRHGDQPWWYYLPVLLAGGLPWVAGLPPAARHTWSCLRAHLCPSAQRSAAEGSPPGRVINEAQMAASRSADAVRPSGVDDPAEQGHPAAGASPPSGGEQPPRTRPLDGVVLVWCWLAGDTLLLSLAGSKLVTYLWPVFPAIGILAAWVWAAGLERQASQRVQRAVRRTTLGVAGLSPAALPLALGLVQWQFDLRVAWPVWALGLAISATAWSGLWLVWGKSLWHVMAGICLSLAVQFVVVMVWVMPLVAEEVSARCLAEHFNRGRALPARLLMVDQRVGSIVFYLDPSLRADLAPGTIRWVRISRLPAPEPGVLVAVAERDLRRAAQWVQLEGVPYQQAGRFRLYEARSLVVRHQSR